MGVSKHLIGPVTSERNLGVGGIIKRDVCSGLPDTVSALVAPLECNLVTRGEGGGKRATVPLSGPAILHLA